MTSAQRNVLILASAQGLAVTGTIMVTTASALVGHMLAVDKSLATLPIALQFTATMAVTIPASLLMARIGRRAGFILGASTQMVGAGCATFAIIQGSFLLFCLSGLLLGMANATSQYYRFAAADAADAKFKPKAISFVLTGGVAAAVFGPQMATMTRDYLPLYPFAGLFLFICLLSIANMAVLAFLRIPKPPRSHFGGGRPMAKIIAQPVFIVAAFGGMIAYGVMVLVMTATPLAMAACDYAFNDSAFVIQWHVLGMFAPAFFTGHLITRFGVLTVMQVGVVLLVGSIVASISGLSIPHFWVGLVLLGVGWNFLFVGATTLLTEAYLPEEKAKVQAINDFLVFGSSAAGSFAAGHLLHTIGWQAVNWGVAPLALMIMVGLIWLKLSGGRRAAV
ncbi:MAG: MFS transporter [Elsteraceae bacterium]